ALYSIDPLKKLLPKLVDFDLINSGKPRFTVGLVNVRSGQMRYFDSREGTIGLDHVLGSSAIPPSFPAVRLDGEAYWDGGIYSNTPMEVVFDDNPRRSSVVFAVHRVAVVRVGGKCQLPVGSLSVIPRFSWQSKLCNHGNDAARPLPARASLCRFVYSLNCWRDSTAGLPRKRTSHRARKLCAGWLARPLRKSTSPLRRMPQSPPRRSGAVDALPPGRRPRRRQQRGHTRVAWEPSRLQMRAW